MLRRAYTFHRSSSRWNNSLAVRPEQLHWLETQHAAFILSQTSSSAAGNISPDPVRDTDEEATDAFDSPVAEPPPLLTS